MRTVKHILEVKTKPFNSVDQDTLVIDALKLINTLNISYLVVIDGEEYKGIFSERDYSRNVILKGRSSNTTTVQEAMSVDLPIVNLDATAEQCMNLINIHKTRYLLAYDENEKFCGVITIHDLLREVLAELKEAGSPLADQLNKHIENNDVY